jgi:hypothetical protein
MFIDYMGTYPCKSVIIWPMPITIITTEMASPIGPYVKSGMLLNKMFYGSVIISTA